jgi:hypothetical protein
LSGVACRRANDIGLPPSVMPTISLTTRRRVVATGCSPLVLARMTGPFYLMNGVVPHRRACRLLPLAPQIRQCRIGELCATYLHGHALLHMPRTRDGKYWHSMRPRRWKALLVNLQEYPCHSAARRAPGHYAWPRHVDSSVGLTSTAWAAFAIMATFNSQRDPPHNGHFSWCAVAAIFEGRSVVMTFRPTKGYCVVRQCNGAATISP